VNESATLNRLRTLGLTASASLSSVPWWRRPIQEVLNQLFQRPLPRKSVNVTPVPRRAAQVVASGDRPQGVIRGSESGGGGAVRVEQLAPRQVYGASGPSGVPEGRRQIIASP
jgi:hypothetical protein